MFVFVSMQAGILSAVPHIVFFIFILGGGVLADFLLSHTNFSITTVRKFMTTIGKLVMGTPSRRLTNLTVGCILPTKIAGISPIKQGNKNIDFTHDVQTATTLMSTIVPLIFVEWPHKICNKLG